MSVVEERADIEELLLSTSIRARRAVGSFGVGGAQFAGVKRMRTDGPGSYARFQFLIQKAHLAVFVKCLLFMEERTSSMRGLKSAFDPKRTWAAARLRPLPSLADT